MKKGDKIIWDSGLGYDLGKFIRYCDDLQYNSCLVEMTTGVVIGENMHSKNEVIPNNSINLARMKLKHGY